MNLDTATGCKLLSHMRQKVVCQHALNLTLLPAECDRPRPQQATNFLSAQEYYHWVVFFRLLRPRTAALRRHPSPGHR